MYERSYKQFCSKYVQLDRPVYVIYTFINVSTTTNYSLLQSALSPIIAYGYLCNFQWKILSLMAKPTRAVHTVLPIKDPKGRFPLTLISASIWVTISVKCEPIFICLNESTTPQNLPVQMNAILWVCSSSSICLYSPANYANVTRLNCISPWNVAFVNRP